jgi:hypothetical protein
MDRPLHTVSQKQSRNRTLTTTTTTTTKNIRVFAELYGFKRSHFMAACADFFDSRFTEVIVLKVFVDMLLSVLHYHIMLLL